MSEGKWVLIPPEDFVDYEWDKHFKIVMFCLEITRLIYSGKVNKWLREKASEWGFTPEEIYDFLWFNFKYFKGHSFDEKFKIVKSYIRCPYCKRELEFVEIKPIKIINKEGE